MTGGDSEHRVIVTAWRRRVVKGRSIESLIAAFDGAFAGLWQRSHPTLGDITLTAIVERVLYVAADKFPVLAALTIDASGLSCQALRSRTDLPHDQVADGIEFVLVEFLTVLGELTAEILTPALHTQLSKRPADASHRADSEDPAP